ncbi:hypothetical protein [Leisingera sp. JC11]
MESAVPLTKQLQMLDGFFGSSAALPKMRPQISQTDFPGYAPGFSGG